jgi:L,D-peptidoglycan transpeptidase YkuD (ErfK/YbiS/YcfS/YnhG family)
VGRTGQRRFAALVVVTAAALAACSSAGGARDASTSRSPSAAPQRTVPISSASASNAAHTASAHRLPLGLTTGRATQVLTALAPSAGSTQGRLQAWRKVDGGWRKVGPAVPAWFGADGLSRHAGESTSATPIGSFTLTQAFGYSPDPGTALPYLHTRPDDWWISQAGTEYNTHQRCASGCGFTQGDPNENLYRTRPYYEYAAVIDYNTRNAPGGVRAGAGSAFFLHVHPAGAGATAGCVAVPRDQLLRVLRWLNPSSHPRILIGVG